VSSQRFKNEHHCSEESIYALLRRARDRGVLAPAVPDWWPLQTFYALIYSAAESVRSGHLAPRDAPGLVLGTLLRGIGIPSAIVTETP
jgi:hypothetical protein